jgi:hypothetical protein
MSVTFYHTACYSFCILLVHDSGWPLNTDGSISQNVGSHVGCIIITTRYVIFTYIKQDGILVPSWNMDGKVKKVELFISEEVYIVRQDFRAESFISPCFINLYLVVVITTFADDLRLSLIPHTALP